MDNIVCFRCLQSDHLENECSTISSPITTKQRCGYCGNQGHTSNVHCVKNFEQRHDIVKLLGYEHFQNWFLEFEFRNWWQVNGRIGVPLFKVYPCKTGERRQWKTWETHAPSLRKDKFHVQQQPTFGFLPSNTILHPTCRVFEYLPRPFFPSTKPKRPPKMPPTVKSKSPPATKFSSFIDVKMDATNCSIKTSDPNIPIRWRQNNRVVSIEIGLSGVSQNEVTPLWEENSLRIEVKNQALKTKYFLELELANDINFLTYRVSSQYIEVKVKKSIQDDIINGKSWQNLYKKI